jgi:hypothetical protein
MLRVVLLRIVAVTLLLGGTVRIFASRTLFRSFGIESLWTDTPYAIYIYRALGGFVVLSGVVVMMVSAAPAGQARLLKGCALGFALIGVVMVVAGVTSGLALRHFLVDPIYCFVVAVLLWNSGR